MAFPILGEPLSGEMLLFIIMGIKLQNSSPSIMQSLKLWVENKISFYTSILSEVMANISVTYMKLWQ